LEAADVDDLTDVVGVVRSNACDKGSILLDSLVISRFDEFLEIGHHLVELLHCVIPLFRVEVVEGVVVLAAVLGRSLALEFSEQLRVPEEEMVSELSDRVIPFPVSPIGSLGGESFDSDVGGYKSIFLGVSTFQLIQQDAAERGRFLILFLILGKGKERQGQKYKRGEWFHG